jgi:hypothetical protein
MGAMPFPNSCSALAMAGELNNEGAAYMQWGCYSEALPLLTCSLVLAKSEVRRLQTILLKEGGARHHKSSGRSISFSFLEEQHSAAAIYQDQKEEKEGCSSNSSNYIFQSPIRIHTVLHAEILKDSVAMWTEVLFCVMFNLALAKHGSTIIATACGEPHHRAYHLQEVLQLYELAYRLQTSIDTNLHHPSNDQNSSGTQDSNTIGMIAILNNVSAIHRELNNTKLYSQCREQLLKAIMFVVVATSSTTGGRAPNDEASWAGSSALNQVVASILPTLLGEIVLAPAA